MSIENNPSPLFTDQEIKTQTAALWRKTFGDTEEFVNLYFSEKYSPECNVTLRPEGRVVGAVQLLPYGFRYLGGLLRVGYLSGLCVDAEYRGRRYSSELIRRAHRLSYERGDVLSLLIPGDEGLRRFYEKPQHGSYWTSTYRRVNYFTVGDAVDEGIEVEAALEWPDELYWAYRMYNRQHLGFDITSDDFFTALAACDIEGGTLWVARRGSRVQGLCLSLPPVDGEVRILFFCYRGDVVANAILSRIFAQEGVERVSQKTPTTGNDSNCQPYVMARVVNVERFLRHIARFDSRLDLRIGVDGDLDIPENNGYYHICGGRVKVVDEQPSTILTPGGLAAYFMGAYPFHVELMLDE